MSIEVARDAARSQHRSFVEGVGGAVNSLYSRLGAQREYYRRLLVENPKEIERLEQLKWEEFDCFHLCIKCGYLGSGEGSCPSCKKKSWINLRNSMMVQHLQDLEESVLDNPPEQIGELIKLLIFLVVLVGFYLPVLFFFKPWGNSAILGRGGPWTIFGWVMGHLFLFIPATLGVYVPLHKLVSRPLAALFLRALPEKATRWLHPVPPPTPTSKLVDKEYGRVKAANEDEVLVAPFTGRPCLAYRVSVLWQPAEELRRMEWVLDESMALNLNLNSTTYPGEEIFVSTSLKEVEHQRYNLDIEQRADLALYMRERGFFFGSSNYRLFEEIIEPNDEVWIASYKEPSQTNVVLYTNSKEIGQPFGKPFTS